MNSPEQNAEPRSGIPSVPTSAIHWFYALFSIGTIYLTAANTLEQAARVKATGWLEIQSIATVQLLQSAGASIAGAAILVEAGNMVIAAIMRERNRRKDREEGQMEGKEQGRRETHTLWAEWNQRRLDAEREGRPFDEPPPQLNNHH